MENDLKNTNEDLEKYKELNKKYYDDFLKNKNKVYFNFISVEYVKSDIYVNS